MPPTTDHGSVRSREPRLSKFFSPIVDAHEAARDTHAELVRELERERAALQRQVILAQRRWRALLAGGTALLVAAYTPLPLRSLTLLGSTAVGYIALATILPRLVAPRRGSLLPAGVVTLDLLAMGVILGAMQATSHAHHFLLAALLVVWAAGMFFGRAVFTYAAVLAGTIYVALALRDVPALEDTAAPVVADLVLFTIVVVALDLALTRFRDRLAQLRQFCRQVAEGDVGLRIVAELSEGGDDVSALASDIDAMRRRLAEQIGLDPLTGCLNRRALESRLRGEWRLARRRGTVIGVLAVDLDHFKDINDAHGHQVGDVVLQQFGAILRAVARESDVVARLGGDEFILLLPDTELEGMRVLAERLRERVAGDYFGTATTQVQLTVSVGAALAHGRDPIVPDDIIAQADRALYQSKETGRNRVSIA